MKPFGDIFASLSIPRILQYLLLLGGVAVIAYAFTHYGPVAGMALCTIPIGLCLLVFSLHNPANAMFGMVVVNYFIMYLGRYVHDAPLGVLLDATILFNLLLLALQAMSQQIEWRRARSGLTVAAAIWAVYCIFELFNPESVSVKGWISSVRSLAFYFFLVVVLTQLLLARFKYLKQLLVVWSVLTLIAVGKALIQKYIGFNDAEYAWLYYEGGAVTHIIYSGIRYFSVYSDAANFGAGMGLAMVVFSISALYYRSPWMRVYLLLVAAAACYGLLISGTRSALAVPFVGYAVFIVLSRRVKVIILGVVALISILFFLNFSTIGQGNATIRRLRSAFDTQDASLQVRLTNQARLRQLMADKPFGAGLGHGGGKAKVFAPDAPISQIPTDSWFVMIWVETGIVGLILHLLILLYILGYGSWLVFFRLHNHQIRGFTIALISGVAGVTVMSYANEVLGQIPTGVFIYMSMAFIFLAPRFEQELAQEVEQTPVSGVGGLNNI